MEVRCALQISDTLKTMLSLYTETHYGNLQFCTLAYARKRYTRARISLF